MLFTLSSFILHLNKYLKGEQDNDPEFSLTKQKYVIQSTVID